MVRPTLAELVRHNCEPTPAARRRGTLSGIRTDAFAQIADDSASDLPHAVPTGSHHNTSVAFDERFMLKLFRGVSPGPNPELEIGHALTESRPAAGSREAGRCDRVSGRTRLANNNCGSARIRRELRRRQKGDARRAGSRYFERVQALEAATTLNPAEPYRSRRLLSIRV